MSALSVLKMVNYSPQMRNLPTDRISDEDVAEVRELVQEGLVTQFMTFVKIAIRQKTPQDVRQPIINLV